jgi:hypothetical protein
MCKRRKWRCASDVFLDAVEDVTIFGRKRIRNASAGPDRGL